ncbi:hypothetical protein HPB51_013866 [Rhipicephalus microplus]|uniref:Mediator of RNA polymerase II transcription subunit 4 n=1 Tax=Rhipicephalus microplus TaxID=6941 RepID=A0A9J6F325_RHIMP|nr:hypothetical protein HPB51_013866 [Rhipicephalus microplus]
MAAPQSTREQLLRLVDDIEIIAKELFENIIAPKNQRLSAAEHGQLAELLVAKDEELKQTLVIAAGQAEVQKTINSLQEEVEKQDHDIHLLQWQLKEAEHLLIGGDIKPPISSNHNSVGMDAKSKENEDVEVMSTDSSSSSSSDSQ